MEKGDVGMGMGDVFLMGFRTLGFRFTGSASFHRSEHKEVWAVVLVTVLVVMIWLMEPDTGTRAVTDLVRQRILDLELVTPRSGKPSWLTMVLVSMLMPELIGAEPGDLRLTESRVMGTACTLLLADLLVETKVKSGLI